MSEELKTRVQELIDSMINPAVAGHGGFVELVDVQDNRVYLQMGGGCQGCGAADITLKQGIERLIKEEIPEVAEVLDATDHSAALAGEVEYPCVLKPLALSASRGVIRANDPREFVAAFRRIAAILESVEAPLPDEARRALLVEEFIPGR